MLYAVNEKVLCFHGPLIYQAKILKAEKWTGEENSGGAVGPHYFVHYQGWKQTWDEWVAESRLLKLNDDNLAKQKALVDARKAAAQAAKAAALAASSSGSKGEGSGSGPRKSAGGSSATPSTSAAGGAAGREASEEATGSSSRRKEARGTKRARETVEQEDEYVKRPEIKIQIPDKLKVQLVDDWENVTRLERLVPLPRRPSVVTILDEYREWYMKHVGAKKGAKGRPPAVLEEVLAGLKLYFDKALSHNLLYRFERAQLVELRKDWAKGVLSEDGKGGVVSSRPEGAAAEGGAGGEEGEESKDDEAEGGATSTPSSSRRGAAAPASAAKKDSADKDKAAANSNGSAKDDASKELEPSRIYGAEHLLRLFVNLPAIIAHTTMDAESIHLLREHLAEFLNFLVKEQKRLFVTSYQDASPAYHRLTQI